MKRLLIMIMLLLPTTAVANEIPGTRVLGQGAICAEGQGKAIDFNIATRTETSYCYEREPIIPPTQEQLEQAAREQIAQTITQQNNANRETIVSDTPITADIEPLSEILMARELNIATGITTIRELTKEENELVQQSRAQDKARIAAQEQAKIAASETQGTEQCVRWSAAGGTGTECAFEPIPATEQEVEDAFSFLYDLFNSNWLLFLNIWAWNW